MILPHLRLSAVSALKFRTPGTLARRDGSKGSRKDDGLGIELGTGEQFDQRETKRKTGFIGESAKYDVYLFYEPDLEYLKATALTLEMARNLPEIREVGPRNLFKRAVASMVLSGFVIRDDGDWRLVSYEADILSRVDWSQAVEEAP